MLTNTPALSPRALGSAAAAFVAASASAASTFQGLGDLPGGAFRSHATAVSADGTAVAGASASTLSASNPFLNEAFLWTPQGGMIPLGDFPGGEESSLAHAVANGGQSVVGIGRSDSGGRAFRWTPGGGLEDLGTLASGGTGFANAHDVTPDGQFIVGTTQVLSGFDAFRWTEPGGMEGLRAFEGREVSSDGAVIAGLVTGPIQAARWTESTGWVPLGILPGGSSSDVADMTPDGSVIVGISEALPASAALGDPVIQHAYRWSQDTGMVPLPDVIGGADFSIARAVSADGSMILGQAGPESARFAVLWDENGARPLQEALQLDHGLDLTGWTLTDAAGISDDGRTLVGTGINPQGNTEAWVARIPAPGTLAPALPLAAAALCRRRRLRSAV